MALKDLVRRRPEGTSDRWSPIAALQRDINRMFEQLWESAPSLLPWSGGEPAIGAFVPKVEVTESENMVEVTAELPGMSDGDVSVSLSPDSSTLMIKGEKKYEKETREREFVRAERSYGSFRRTIPLPSQVEGERAEAAFRNGVLEIRLPKPEESRRGTKHIPVRS